MLTFANDIMSRVNKAIYWSGHTFESVDVILKCDHSNESY